MELFRETIASWTDWGRVYQSIEDFRDLIGFIYRKEGIPFSNISRCTPGTNAVFRLGGTVIKIFAPKESGLDTESDYNTERFGLRKAEELGIPAPKLLAGGAVRDRYEFRYFIMEYIEGTELGEYCAGIDNREKERIGRELRRITDRINRPLTGECGSPNQIDVKRRALTAERWKGFPERFNRERKEYLNRMRLTDSDLVYVHGDLTQDNILADQSGALILIDFADSLLAPACYELPTLVLEVFGFERPFLDGYFGTASEQGGSAEEIAAAVFDGLLLHDFGGDLIRRHIGEPERITDLKILKNRLREYLE